MIQSRDPKQGPTPAPDVESQQWPGVEGRMTPPADHGEQSYRGSGKLEGLAAVITGGDSGIGRATAIAFAREGADVAIAYVGEMETEDAEETAEWVRQAGRKTLTYRMDQSDPQQCRAFVNEAVKGFGRLDIVVNNAAYQCEQESILDITPEQLDRTFRTNFYGYFFMAQAAVPHLKEGASIINCGSVVGLDGSPSLLDYSATKGAIHTFTKSLAKNLAGKGIRVNCVAPGPAWTPLAPSTLEKGHVRHFGEDTAWGRPAQPAEIAPSFVFFASTDSRYYTGDIMAPTGKVTSR